MKKIFKILLKLLFWYCITVSVLLIIMLFIYGYTARQGRGYENENSIVAISCTKSLIDSTPKPLFFLKQKRKCSDATGVQKN